MANMGVSNVHRVLTIPELLDMVFSFLDDKGNASNALVCKQWSEVALDTLWREVDDLVRLFSLLAPLQRNTVAGEYKFKRLPESKDWRYFEKYSRRVRKLTFHAESYALGQSVFDDVARTRTTLNILPNMNTLFWDAPPPLCVMFMHSNVKQLILVLPNPSEDAPLSPCPFFEDIVSRMPNITCLDLRTIVPANAIESDVIQLLKGLTNLRKVVFPRFYFTTRIAECLSRFDNLAVVEFQYYHEQGHGDPDDTAVFQPVLGEGAFPALWDLSITVRFKDASRFINIPFAPTNLTTLYIDSDLIEAPADVYNALSMIAENCQLLRSLALVSDCNPTAQVSTPPSEDDYITMDTLKPLLHCPNLISLELVHQYPLELQQKDVEALAASWPSLECLILNNEPVLLDRSNLTLYALLPFARRCPKLRELGMFIHATSADFHSLQQSELLPYSMPDLYPSFQKLKMLSMGTSIISDPGPVALFLSKICPLSVQMESGITWEDSSSVPEIADTIRERCDKWDKVQELLPLLTKLRMEERERTRSLQSEVQDLRLRTGLLMDKAVMNGGDACVTS